MNIHKEKLEHYLKEHPVIGEELEVGSILEFLSKRYLEDNPITSEKINKIEQEMGPYYENVPFATSERLFRLVYDLCDAYSDAAFRAGLLMGLHLREAIASDW